MTTATERFERLVETTRLFAYNLRCGDKDVGRIVIRRSASNGSTEAFVQLWGCEMVRGTAKGYGYDKTSAAVRNAFRKLHQAPAREGDDATKWLIIGIQDADGATGAGHGWKDVLSAVNLAGGMPTMRKLEIQHVI